MKTFSFDNIDIRTNKYEFKKKTVTIDFKTF